ncbi:MAG: glycosyltransferase family 4 protein [Thermodesulfovibrionales bacterium]
MTKERFKILMVVHCFLPESVGGSEVYTYNLSKLLMGNGFDVTVLTTLQDLTLERYKVIKTDFEGINVIKIVNSQFYVNAFIDYFMNPRIDRMFMGILGEEKPDLIHFQHIAYLSGRLPEIAYQMNIPSIFTIHDYWYICYRSQLIRPNIGPCPGPSEGIYCASCNEASTPNPTAVPRIPMLNKMIQLPVIRKLNFKERLSPGVKQKVRSILYKQPAAEEESLSNPYILTILENKFRFDFFKRQFLFPKIVTSPSYHLKRRYENEGYREILHLPLGFNSPDKVERLVFSEKLKIAYLGNIVPWKGAIVILRELLKLQKKGAVEVHFHGRPNDKLYLEEIKNLARAFPEGSIKFHGAYRGDKELKEILSRVHLVVFPSLWEENYPLVVREALLRGVPVIGSKLGGVPEAVEDGVNGFIFDPYKEGDLAEKINLILESPKILEKITEGARNTKIENMEDHVGKIIKMYRDAIAYNNDIKEYLLMPR